MVSTQTRAWPPWSLKKSQKGQRGNKPARQTAAKVVKEAKAPCHWEGRVARSYGPRADFPQKALNRVWGVGGALGGWRTGVGAGDRDWLRGDPGQRSAGRGSLSPQSWHGNKHGA